MENLISKIETLILLDYKVSFEKCSEVPGFEIKMISDNGKEDKCILPYHHLNENGIVKYLSQMYINLGR